MSPGRNEKNVVPESGTNPLFYVILYLGYFPWVDTSICYNLTNEWRYSSTHLYTFVESVGTVLPVLQFQLFEFIQIVTSCCSVRLSWRYQKYCQQDFHLRGPCSIPGQSIWDLWWTKWHWGGGMIFF